jgi:putative phosphoesterase
VRVAIVSDTHGNLPALDAVIEDLGRERPDLVVHGGDLALGGPQPGAVVDRIRELGWPGVRGNSDEVFWDWSRAPQSIAWYLELVVPIGRQMIGPDRIAWLQTLPLDWHGDGIGLVHSIPGDPWPVVLREASDAELTDTYSALGEPVAVYGHIHAPYVRRLPRLTVANSGSAGNPADGDWRASYLLITDGEPSIRRVEYDLERELAALARSGLPGAERLAEGRRQGRLIQPVRS